MRRRHPRPDTTKLPPMSEAGGLPALMVSPRGRLVGHGGAPRPGLVRRSPGSSGPAGTIWSWWRENRPPPRGAGDGTPRAPRSPGAEVLVADLSGDEGVERVAGPDHGAAGAARCSSTTPSSGRLARWRTVAGGGAGTDGPAARAGRVRLRPYSAAGTARGTPGRWSTCHPWRRSSTPPAASTTARLRPTSRPSPRGSRRAGRDRRASPGPVSGFT